MENLRLYEQCRAVPKEAQKPITAGRLKGFTDINPMWRIKKLTEMFGPVGIGWYVEVDKHWTDKGAEGIEVVQVAISLYYKYENEWSKPIIGIGGSQLIAKEFKGMYTDDESYKKALTDAIGGACKLLGIGADIWWGNDRSKYDALPQQNSPQKQPDKPQKAQAIKDAEESIVTGEVVQTILSLCTIKQFDFKAIEKGYGKPLNKFTIKEAEATIRKLQGM